MYMEETNSKDEEKIISDFQILSPFKSLGKMDAVLAVDIIGQQHGLYAFTARILNGLA
jgi:hypothetical protein